MIRQSLQVAYSPGCYAARSDCNPSANVAQRISSHRYVVTTRPVEKIVTHSAVKQLRVPVLSWTAWLYECSIDARVLQKSPHEGGRELISTVAAQMPRTVAHQEWIAQQSDRIMLIEAEGCLGGQTFSR